MKPSLTHSMNLPLSLRSSPSHWLQHLQSLWYSTNPVTTETNGFQLFLRLICVTMATSGEEGKLWRLLKGR